MSAPKVDTIKRHCDSDLAVEMLRERGVLTVAEAADLSARIRVQREAMYADVYGDRTDRPSYERQALNAYNGGGRTAEAAREAIRIYRTPR